MDDEEDNIIEFFTEDDLKITPVPLPDGGVEYRCEASERAYRFLKREADEAGMDLDEWIKYKALNYQPEK